MHYGSEVTTPMVISLAESKPIRHLTLKLEVEAPPANRFGVAANNQLWWPSMIKQDGVCPSFRGDATLRPVCFSKSHPFRTAGFQDFRLLFNDPLYPPPILHLRSTNPRTIKPQKIASTCSTQFTIVNQL